MFNIVLRKHILKLSPWDLEICDHFSLFLLFVDSIIN